MVERAGLTLAPAVAAPRIVSQVAVVEVAAAYANRRRDGIAVVPLGLLGA